MIFASVLRLGALAGAVCLAAMPALGATHFTGVGAGDMTSSDVVVWTRADDGGKPAAVTAQVAADPGFGQIVATAGGSTVPANNFTLKLLIGGLDSGQTYFYRFVDNLVTGDSSPIGRFTTAPLASQDVPVRFGFSGDADGRWRPYPLIATISDRNLNYFVFLGDTIYETGSAGSAPAATLTQSDGDTQAQQALADYDRKYIENLQGVDPAGQPSTSGQQGLTPMFLATGHYTLLDNHELGNVSLQSGGAPASLTSARSRPETPQYDTTPNAPFTNQTAAFKALEKAFFNNQPTRADVAGTPEAASLTITGPTVSAPNDPRTDGTARNYFAQQWGRHSIYIQTDNRSYRDARLGLDAKRDDLGPRADNPARTMLGRTQFAWLKQTLRAAQDAGTTWKFVALSSPIDQVGAQQDGKSWYGGYRQERNDLLSFIATNGISHVVFLSTDDHYSRATRLLYRTDFADPATTRPVPDAFLLVTGPIGAGGPDRMKDRHGFDAIRWELKQQNDSIVAAGGVPIGLQGMPGLAEVFREGDPAATTAPSSADFYSPDTFAYMVLEVGADGVLAVQTWGVDSYGQNIFRQGLATRLIMSFMLRP